MTRNFNRKQGTGRPDSGQAGIGIMELVVSMGIAATAALGVCMSLATSIKVAKHTEAHYAASVLASSRMEELASVNLDDLDETYNETNKPVSSNALNIDFLRSTDVDVNADGSRTVRITVASSAFALPVSVDFTTTFSRWE